MDSPNIKFDQDIRSGIKLETLIEMNIIDIRKAKITSKNKNCIGIDDLDVIQTKSQRKKTQNLHGERNFHKRYMTNAHVLTISASKPFYIGWHNACKPNWYDSMHSIFYIVV